MKCVSSMFVSTDLQYITVVIFPFQSQLWGIPVCCQVRSEQIGCVRNLSKKKIGELQHLLTL